MRVKSESLLFGHEKDACTGALSSRPGKIEPAGGGVLFVDEVGEGAGRFEPPLGS